MYCNNSNCNGKSQEVRCVILLLYKYCVWVFGHALDRLFFFLTSQVTVRRPVVSRARPEDTSAAVAVAAAAAAVTGAPAAWASTSATARRPARRRCPATCRQCRRYTIRRPAFPVRHRASRGTWSRRTCRRWPAILITIRITRPPGTCRSTAGTRPTVRTRAFYREYKKYYILCTTCYLVPELAEYKSFIIPVMSVFLCIII